MSRPRSAPNVVLILTDDQGYGDLERWFDAVEADRRRIAW